MISTTYVNLKTDDAQIFEFDHMLWITMDIDVPQYDNTDLTTMIKSMDTFDKVFEQECEAFDQVSATVTEFVKQFKGKYEIETSIHRITINAESKEDLMLLKLAISG